MLLSPMEIIDMVVMTFIIGYIFKDVFPIQEHPTTIDVDYIQRVEYNRFWFAILAVAPAILLHELGHKFMAIAFGITATFHAAYDFLLLGLVLKVLNFPFIFFVPAYVSHGPTTALAGAAIAFAGPLVNGILWLIARYSLNHKLIPKKYRTLMFFVQYINGFLFILNMIPIPGFDGYHVLSGLIQALF